MYTNMASRKLVCCFSRTNSIILNRNTSIYNSYLYNTSHITLLMVRNLSIAIHRYLFHGPRFYFSSDANQEKPAKKKHGSKITLIGEDDGLIVTSLEDADKIAKRRDLKLVKIVDIDTKSQRPIYKLMTGAQYFEEDLKQRKLKLERRKTDIKGEKLMSISSKISENDLQARLNKLKKWLEKHYEARLIISTNSNTDNIGKILERIQDYVKDQGRIVQIRKKEREVKFNILPLKKENVKPSE